MPLDAAVGILLLAMCAHVGVLLVGLARALLPQRRHPQRGVGIAAGIAALAGELLALGGLLGEPARPAWMGGILGLAILLAVAARSGWRQHAAGRLAFQALFAPPLVVTFVAALSFR